MTTVSYAQNFEDVMLLRALSRIERGFYIDVGAAAPEADSVTKLFSDRGWHGVNIEPTPHLLDQLKARRDRDINLGLALSDYEGSATFHVIDETGLSSLSEEVVSAHVASGLSSTELTVPVTTLRALWQAHVPDGQDVHFLKIDVEGEEAGVVRGADWDGQRPWIVVVEATRPASQTPSHEEWEPILLGHRYRFVYWDGLNRFYLAEEHAELAAAFETPPNVFDDFVLYRQVLVEAQVRHLAEQKAELSDQRKQLRADMRLQSRALETLKHDRDALTARLAELQHHIADRDQHLAAVVLRKEALERQLRYYTRPFWQRRLFRRNGRPVRAFRRLLFHRSGRPRDMFRTWVLRTDGSPRQAFNDWITSPEYQALPRAIPLARPPVAGEEWPNMSPRTRYFMKRLETARAPNERS